MGFWFGAIDKRPKQDITSRAMPVMLVHIYYQVPGIRRFDLFLRATGCARFFFLSLVVAPACLLPEHPGEGKRPTFVAHEEEKQ